MKNIRLFEELKKEKNLFLCDYFFSNVRKYIDPVHTIHFYIHAKIFRFMLEENWF